MTQQTVDIFFKLVAFFFAVSIHESAHAWMASRCGDPTARMLGRISLNPLRHIDPIGSVVLPLVAALTHLPVIGWAKPVPVDSRNLRNQVVDEILVSVAGPGSNFLVVLASLQVMFLLTHISTNARAALYSILLGGVENYGIMSPIVLIVFDLMLVNVLLGVFNLIPIPPLDGSKVLRPFLPDSVRDVYDRFGFIALLALVFLGGNVLRAIFRPVLFGLESILVRM
jgi:Zn-dependent protease